MNRYNNSLVLSVLLVACFVGSLGFTGWAYWNSSSPSNLIEPVEASQMTDRPWLSRTDQNFCSKEPCLAIEHETVDENSHLMKIFLTTYPISDEANEIRLTTNISFNRQNGILGDTVALVAKHTPTPDLVEALRQQGVDPSALKEPKKVYFVDGSFTARTISIDLPYGAFPQFMFDAFQKTAHAMGLDPDAETLMRYANIATTEVNDRFNIDELTAQARFSMIVAGQTQTLTYIVAFLAICFTIAERSSLGLRPYADGLTDLIPFTGFFGTLIGVAGGLEILGISDVTNDVSKSLSLGQIGSSLGFAIHTTILALVVFGMVILLQYAIRTSRSTNKSAGGNEAT